MIQTKIPKRTPAVTHGHEFLVSLTLEAILWTPVFEGVEIAVVSRDHNKAGFPFVIRAKHRDGVWITILTELLGGLAILLGAFVSLVSLPMAALLLVAIFTVHLPYGFSSIKLMAVTATGAQFGPPGYECDLLYLACLAALVLGGSGPLAIDGLLRKNKRTLKHKCHHDWSAS